MATVINSIDLAKDVKNLILFSTVKFDDADLKNKILGADDKDFLFISKSINSDPTIIDVKLIDDAFIENAVLG